MVSSARIVRVSQHLLQFNDIILHFCSPPIDRHSLMLKGSLLGTRKKTGAWFLGGGEKTKSIDIVLLVPHLNGYNGIL